MVVRRVLGLVGLGSAPDAKDVEIAVLPHQLIVVRRQITQPLPAHRPDGPVHPGETAALRNSRRPIRVTAGQLACTSSSASP
jgi:hypothetical protein